MAERPKDRTAGWHVRAVVTFVVLVVACAALLATTAGVTRDRIEQNRNRQFLDLVGTLTGGAAPAAIHWDGDLAHLCDGHALLRGSVQGYAGAVRWLAAVAMDGASPALTRVRITAHQETPGIADFLDRPERGWLAALIGLDADALAGVNTVSGATITSRALRRSLAAGLADARLDTVPDGCAP